MSVPRAGGLKRGVGSLHASRHMLVDQHVERRIPTGTLTARALERVPDLQAFFTARFFASILKLKLESRSAIRAQIFARGCNHSECRSSGWSHLDLCCVGFRSSFGSHWTRARSIFGQNPGQHLCANRHSKGCAPSGFHSSRLLLAALGSGAGGSAPNQTPSLRLLVATCLVASFAEAD